MCRREYSGGGMGRRRLAKIRRILNKFKIHHFCKFRRIKFACKMKCKALHPPPPHSLTNTTTQQHNKIPLAKNIKNIYN